MVYVMHTHNIECYWYSFICVYSLCILKVFILSASVLGVIWVRERS